MNWDALRLSLQITFFATILIAIIGLGLALLLSRREFAGKTLLELLIALPLILPPSVVGYYLLVTLGRNGPVVQWLHLELLFTWPAAVIAAVVVGLPLMVLTARSAIDEIDPEIENAARLGGASEWQLLRFVTFPLARRGILAGLVLASARALGEFGATLMIAGDIPGRTQTMSMAIYDAVQSRQYDAANLMVLVMTSVAFVGLWLAMRWGYGRGRKERRWRKSTATGRSLPAQPGIPRRAAAKSGAGK
jgi:molybdate transport system permease protein